MKTKLIIYSLGMALIVASAIAQEPAEKHGWLNNETLKTPFGDFEFKNGYPAGDTTQRLLDQLKLNRAVEVYLTQMMAVSAIATREGMREFGQTKSNQLVIWEQLMGPDTVWLTANTETVYAMGFLDLKAEGPIVVDAPPKMLGFLQDGLQRYLMDIGMVGPDKGAGGKFLVLPPDYKGETPKGYFVAKSPTYAAMFAMRGFQTNGSTDEAVSLMKKTKVYPLSKASSPPAMEFLNGSKKQIDTLFPDNFHYFELLSMLVNEEPADCFTPLEKFQMQAIGIEKGKPFNPDTKAKSMLEEAARVGGAMGRANSFGPPAAYYYPDRKWQGVTSGLSYTFVRDGIPQVDARNNVYYMAAGNSPAMVEKNVGKGSQYLWTYRDAADNYLDGAKTYRLHVLPNIPAKNFWSVVVYDSLSRSELQGGQPLPSVSSYTKPVTNSDGSIDITFAPTEPNEKTNWIQTVPGKGWFPIFRFYSPTEAYFDKTWKLNDIEKVK